MFTTTQLVKELSGDFTQSSNDAQLSAVVDGVNAKIEDFLSRYPIIGDYSDEFDILPTTSVTYKLKGYPVTEITSVMIDGDEIDSSYYRVNLSTGLLQLNFDQPLGVGLLTVEYNGGMAVDESTLRSSFPAITYEATMQALFEFKAKFRLGNTSLTSAGGSTEAYVPFTLRKETRRALMKYRRVSMVA